MKLLSLVAFIGKIGQIEIVVVEIKSIFKVISSENTFVTLRLNQTFKLIFKIMLKDHLIIFKLDLNLKNLFCYETKKELNCHISSTEISGLCLRKFQSVGVETNLPK